ncbi:hypothetical protein K458DRAFT_200280 [Lentithecium fluviatile CBS 122367]|uniref:Uncharacterized protein n=1 Tax=Lentithecium fluviatile CBS 122367 TaxID=1168545 RepID=A0A6G1J8Y0_9PLEO|nr:hypothetical protein K458DRAFT_200280 [Lentithecium fluviatile CBS 122367]
MAGRTGEDAPTRLTRTPHENGCFFHQIAGCRISTILLRKDITTQVWEMTFGSSVSKAVALSIFILYLYQTTWVPLTYYTIPQMNIVYCGVA